MTIMKKRVIKFRSFEVAFYDKGATTFSALMIIGDFNYINDEWIEQQKSIDESVIHVF